MRTRMIYGHQCIDAFKAVSLDKITKDLPMPRSSGVWVGPRKREKGERDRDRTETKMELCYSRQLTNTF